jgi:hypothetical protein
MMSSKAKYYAMRESKGAFHNGGAIALWARSYPEIDTAPCQHMDVIGLVPGRPTPGKQTATQTACVFHFVLRS